MSIIIVKLCISHENKNREKIKSSHHFKGLNTCHLLAIFYVNCMLDYRVFNKSASHNKNIGFVESTMQLCHKFIQKHSIEIHKPYRTANLSLSLSLLSLSLSLSLSLPLSLSLSLSSLSLSLLSLSLSALPLSLSPLALSPLSL